MEKVLKCMTVLVLFWGISMFVDFGGVKHQNFNSGFPQEKALSVLEVKPARIVHQGDYEVLRMRHKDQGILDSSAFSIQEHLRP